MVIMNRPIWFRITLIDCNGQNLAMWTYDERFPVTPPMFTYPNEDAQCPYWIEFVHLRQEKRILQVGIDLNIAIHIATKKFRVEIKDKT